MLSRSHGNPLVEFRPDPNIEGALERLLRLPALLLAGIQIIINRILKSSSQRFDIRPFIADQKRDMSQALKERNKG